MQHPLYFLQKLPLTNLVSAERHFQPRPAVLQTLGKPRPHRRRHRGKGRRGDEDLV